MGYEPRLIAPYENSGLQKYYKPWLISDEAFEEITDAFAWRGTVRKRDGFRLLATIPTGMVQGLPNFYEPSTGVDFLFAFSKTKAYRFDTGLSSFIDYSTLATGAVFSFTGGDDDFFWTCNAYSALWVTNNFDSIYFYNGATMPTGGFNAFTPTVSGATTLQKGLLIMPYKGRLVVLNTTEAGNNYAQRARWSQVGTPYVAGTPPAPFATQADAWRDDIPGKGGYTDANTNERILTAAIIKDVMIVFFQRSTWRLRYTGNEVLPFIWERINTQYGSESTFSVIPFDDMALAFSRFGYIGSDMNNVDRIDEIVPDLSFGMDATGTLQGLKRVHGIRDYYRQIAYWTYAENGAFVGGNVTCTQVVAYNYVDKSWQIFNQRFRCFGTFRRVTDEIWSSFTDDPADTWQVLNRTWDSALSADGFPFVVAGDADGRVLICYEPFSGQAQDYGGVAARPIQNITPGSPTLIQCNAHGFITGDIVRFSAITGTVSTELNDAQFSITVIDPNNFSITQNTTGLLYTAGGTASVTTNFGFTILSKRFNPYIDQGMRCRLGYIDLYVTGTEDGQITLQHFVDDQTTVPVLTTVVRTRGTPSDTRYVRVYLGAIGRMHQIKLTLSTSQVFDQTYGRALFEMQGMVVWTRMEGRIRG